MGDELATNHLTSGTVKKKKDEKHRRRDPRAWDNIKKATMGMTEEEKEAYYTKMYSEIYNENRTLSNTLQAREKQLQVMQKESDRDRSELTKSILARGQLESLCRELQKQNRLIKEENIARIKEEEDRRREVANTFTERLNALTNLITESKDKSNKVKEENQNMTEKLTELYEQYQQRENHIETVTKQLDLQKKLAETQAKKTEIEHEAERQTLIAEKKALVMQLEQYEREIVLLQEKNRSLEAQVDLYKSQYSDFETTMSKSNKVFDTFKEEMSRMNKQLHTLEAERNDLRKRWQSSVNSLIVLSEQHVALSNEQKALEKRLSMLQKLCRQLQEDRSAFLKQLKENNIEPVVPTIKNEDTCEKEIAEASLGTSNDPLCALKIKQELGKTTDMIMSDSSLSESNSEHELSVPEPVEGVASDQGVAENATNNEPPIEQLGQQVAENASYNGPTSEQVAANASDSVPPIQQVADDDFNASLPNQQAENHAPTTNTPRPATRRASDADEFDSGPGLEFYVSTGLLRPNIRKRPLPRNRRSAPTSPHCAGEGFSRVVEEFDPSVPGPSSRGSSSEGTSSQGQHNTPQKENKEEDETNDDEDDD